MGTAARTFTLILAGLAATASIAGCTSLRAHRGAILDPLLSASIEPGVDNRESVEKTLGRPTFTGQFTPNQWYYVSRNTKQIAFGNPRPFEQTVLRVTFDPAGNVAAVDKTGVDQVASISPNGDKTPTNGIERTFFEELFGNIGSVGLPGAPGGTPPQ